MADDERRGGDPLLGLQSALRPRRQDNAAAARAEQHLADHRQRDRGALHVAHAHLHAALHAQVPAHVQGLDVRVAGQEPQDLQGHAALGPRRPHPQRLEQAPTVQLPGLAAQVAPALAARHHETRKFPDFPLFTNERPLTEITIFALCCLLFISSDQLTFFLASGSVNNEKYTCRDNWSSFLTKCSPHYTIYSVKYALFVPCMYW